MVYDTEHELFPSWGPTITTTTVHKGWPRDARVPASWFLIQDGGYARELQRLTGLFRASIWTGRNRYKKLGSKAEILKSDGKAPERPHTVPTVLHNADLLRSPVDGVLDAVTDGSFQFAVPKQLQGKLGPLLDELSKPLLPAIVDRTIERAVQRQPRLLQGIARWGARRFGDAQTLAQDAAHAVVELGGLPREKVASKTLGYDGHNPDKRLILLAMGKDEVASVLYYDEKADRLLADLDLERLAPLYRDEELSMRDVAKVLAGELRVNPAWSFLGKPITVHNQGGCRMSAEAKNGVTDPDGMVHGCEGLYVLDGRGGESFGHDRRHRGAQHQQVSTETPSAGRIMAGLPVSRTQERR